MKKFIAIALGLAAGAVVFAKVRASRSETDLWHEATTALKHTAPAERGTVLPHGDVAQLAEHRLCKAGVRGSIPLVSTTLTSGNSLDRREFDQWHRSMASSILLSGERGRRVVRAA